MKSAIAFAFLLTVFTGIYAQTPEDLVRDVQANAKSVAALRRVIEKYAALKDTNTHWAYYYHTNGFFGQKKFFQSFTFHDPSARKDVPAKTMNLFVTYTGDTVRYIKLESFHYEFTGTLAGITNPVYYFDSVYTYRLLSTYNFKHKTNFTHEDLYEDECNIFCIVSRPGLVNTYKKPDGSQGKVFYSHEFGEFWLSIRDGDHRGIIRNCMSFNTTRKAYGALCLYVMQRNGEGLTWEEKELMQKILNSTETISYRAACKRSDGVPIKDLLTPQELKRMYSYLYNGAGN